MVIKKSDSQKKPIVRPHDLLREIEVCPQALVVFGSFDWISHLVKVHPVAGSRKNFKFCSLQTFTVNNTPITFAGPVMSAPVAAMVLEILIAFGARHIIGVGSCGSLDEKLRIGHLVIPENSIPDEGTSSHYPMPGKKINASPRIIKRIQSLCEAKAQTCTCGRVWTTDAPFRETPQKIKKAQQKKAIAVEMELSAFFKVGAFYGVEVGALLVVSDELFARGWNPGYGNPKFKETFVQALDIVLQVLSQSGREDTT
ncbi:MAG: nucleoside phosphorylase [Thermodesulfobacteriota bacterium]|jgi:purine-nucleoside phosphorylase|nr:MAG: nucleoside phosphorylase [Thermodesulfobacteriota bacterium]